MKKVGSESKRPRSLLTLALTRIAANSGLHLTVVELCRVALVTVVPLFLTTQFCGCVSKNSRQGVENRWRNDSAPVFKQGETTSHDVLAALGPPSQLINLGNQTVYYYLQEQKRTRSIILILYNQTREKISYDRAIFFFDTQGRLTDFAISDEKNPSS